MNRSRKSLVQPMLLALILGLGAAGIWLFVWGIMASIVDQWTAPQLWEYLKINGQGEVVIEQIHRGSDITYRNLTGQTLTDLLAIRPEQGYSLPAANAAHFQTPLDWPERIAGFQDDQTPRNFWYLIREERPNGRGYFVGYNSQSKQQIGYLDATGFRSSLPPDDEQFTLSTQKVGGIIAGHGRSGMQPYNYTYPAEIDGLSQALLISDGKLFALDFKQSSVQSLALPEKPLSVSMAYVPLTASPDAILKQSIMIRTPNSVFVLDPAGKILRTITIPPDLREQGFDVYFSANLRVILVTDISGWVHPPEVYWANDQGEISRHETVALHVNPPADPRLVAWGGAFLAPAPLVFASGLLLVVPIANVENGLQPNFAAALAHWWNAGWPALLVVIVLSITLAVYCFRRQRQMSQRGSLVWAIFVALLGVPGLIGYLLHRHWPAKEKCAKCGEVTPRDRDACLNCGTEFPLPALKGIEIFAEVILEKNLIPELGHAFVIIRFAALELRAVIANGFGGCERLIFGN